MDPVALIALVVVLAVAVVFLRRKAPATRHDGAELPKPRRAKPLARPLSTGTPRDLGTMSSTSGRGGSGVWPFVGDESAMTAEMPVADTTFPLTNSDRRSAPEVSTRPAGSSRVQSGRIEYHRPAPNDGTLQFIPGRLEIVEGEEERHEIRFVRGAGDKTEVTFGRNSGEPYRHVQLHSRTVSRLHARMTYSDNAWTLTNLSETNPTVLNQEPLGGSAPLKDGDRIEMGEVVFTFRER